MCVMVVCSKGKLQSILERLGAMDVSHIYFYNTNAPEGVRVPFISLVPFANMVVCEDSVLDSDDFREGMILHEAIRMSIPVVSERVLATTSVC